MKKRITILVALLLVVVSAMSVVLAGCGMFGDKGGGDNNNQQTEPVTYTIQYTDDNGTHTITVQSGQPYSIETIPQRNGYEFMGLFDAQTGGTQYVAANGSSIAPFTDNKNMVLFPQFKAKKYKVVLNYGEAPVTGMREIDVDYGSELPELPVNLVVENKDFLGWYTEPGGKGVQIADTYGVLPDRRLVTEQNFDLSDANGYIYLYAGFRGKMRTVTFYVEDSYTPIEMEVEHGTLITDIVPKYRTEEGFAVYEWTQSSNPTESSPVFRGAIEADTVLYAKTYAPVIELDPNGGEDITPVVLPAGKSVTLPTPVRENYKFLYWADEDGEEATYTTMPSASVSLTAVWQAMIVFDENGGDEVKDISAASGTTITLPVPVRDGYIFAGWFDADGEKYESTKMPSASVALKAGWYKAKEETVIIISSTSEKGGDKPTSSPNFSYLSYEIDPTDYIEESGDFHISIDAYVKLRGYSDYEYTGYLNVYNQKSISSSTLIESFTFEHVTNEYAQYSFELDLYGSNTVYLCFWSEEHKSSGAWAFNYLHLSDFYYTVSYPDTSVMY